MTTLQNLPLAFEFELIAWLAGLGCLFAVVMRELWDDPLVQNTGRALAVMSFTSLVLFGYHAVDEYGKLQKQVISTATQAKPVFAATPVADMRIEHGDTTINWNRDHQPTSFVGSQYR